jgi:hypothetical protein
MQSAIDAFHACAVQSLELLNWTESAGKTVGEFERAWFDFRSSLAVCRRISGRFSVPSNSVSTTEGLGLVAESYAGLLLEFFGRVEAGFAREIKELSADPRWPNMRLIRKAVENSRYGLYAFGDDPDHPIRPEDFNHELRRAWGLFIAEIEPSSPGESDSLPLALTDDAPPQNKPLKGVSLRDIGRALGHEGESLRDFVRRFSKSKKINIQVIGKDPGKGKARLYELGPILDCYERWQGKNRPDDMVVKEEVANIRKALKKVLREPYKPE